MNLIKNLLIFLAALGVAPLVAADKEKELASTVNSFMIESYNNIINMNLLIELCALDSYLMVNTNSQAFNDRLHSNIKKFAGFANLEDYSTNEIAADVEVKFKSFVQGVRYGGFIADNFIKTRYPDGVCTKEIKSELTQKIAELAKQEEFFLENGE